MLNFYIFSGKGFPGGLNGKESAYNSGDPGLIPGWERRQRSPGEGNGNPLHYSWVSLAAQMVKNRLQCRRPGLNPWAGKIPGGGHGNPLHYSCLENPLDRRVWKVTVYRVAKSQAQLKQLSTNAMET